jgi:hypothetical protein
VRARRRARATPSRGPRPSYDASDAALMLLLLRHDLFFFLYLSSFADSLL